VHIPLDRILQLTQIIHVSVHTILAVTVAILILLLIFVQLQLVRLHPLWMITNCSDMIIMSEIIKTKQKLNQRLVYVKTDDQEVRGVSDLWRNSPIDDR
jgi:hypothetical protein